MLAWSAVDVTPPSLRAAFLNAVAVNTRGAVLAEASSRPGSSVRQLAFVWEGGRVRILRYGDAGFVDAVAINEKGEVVGDGDVGGDVHGFLWQNGTLTDLPGLGGNETHAWLIDDHGDVAGVSALPSGTDHAVLWPAGATTPTDLGSVGSLDSSVDGMNASGTIVGFASDHVGNARIALEWRDGRLIDLGRFGAQGAQAVAVNSRGDVLVQTQTLDGNARGIRLVRGGKTIVVASPRRGYAVAVGLDDLGDVLGYLQVSGRGRRSFIWRSGKTTLLPTTDGSQPPWGGPSAIANGYAVGDEYVALASGDTAHVVLWRAKR